MNLIVHRLRRLLISARASENGLVLPVAIAFIRLSGKAYAVAENEQKKWRDIIFEEQPYLANVYPGDTREIGIIFCMDQAEVEYFNLGVNPIFRETYILGNVSVKEKGYYITESCIGCGKYCYQPCHNCIDNCIHTYAGIQLRNYCNDMMMKQGQEEPTGQAKITPAFNLPCEYVIHTVGPIVQGKLTKEQERLLISCYESCLRIADENDVKSIAFCCISTGVFMFPNKRAAELAIQTVKQYKEKTKSVRQMLLS